MSFINLDRVDLAKDDISPYITTEILYSFIVYIMNERPAKRGREMTEETDNYAADLRKILSSAFQAGVIRMGKMKLLIQRAYNKRDDELENLERTMDATYQQLHAFSTMYPGIIIQSDNKEELYDSISAALLNTQGPSGQGFVDGTEGMSQGSRFSGAATTAHLQRLYIALYQLRHPDAPVPHDIINPGRNNAPLVYLAYVLLHGTDEDVCHNALITRLGETITKETAIEEMTTCSATDPPAGPPAQFPPAVPSSFYPPAPQLRALTSQQVAERTKRPGPGFFDVNPGIFAPESSASTTQAVPTGPGRARAAPTAPRTRGMDTSRGGGRKRSKKGKITKGKCKYSYKCKPQKKKQLCTYTYKCPSKKSKTGSKQGKCKYTYKCKAHKKRKLCKYTYKCGKKGFKPYHYIVTDVKKKA